jgi:chemotaxis protein CheY-P-specific phosphatase CheC
MNDFDRMINSLTLLNEVELEALAEVCQTKIEAKKKARREGLRQELMGNLQSALSDILHNDFTLTIKNTERNHEYDDYDEVFFEPEDIYSIEMKDNK